MQNRTFSENCLRTLIVSCCALSLSSTAFAKTDESVQRRAIPVGMSPSSVQPDLREGQLSPSGSKVSRGEQVSQGGKQESLLVTPPTGGVASGLFETVTDPVHFDVLVKPLRLSSVIYTWENHKSNVDPRFQRYGELVESNIMSSSIEGSILDSAKRERQSAKHLRAAKTHRFITATEALRRADYSFAHSI